MLVVAPKASSRQEVVQNLELGLKKMLQNPQARLEHVLEFDSLTRPIANTGGSLFGNFPDLRSSLQIPYS